MPSSRVGQMCYVVFGTLGLTAALGSLYVLVVMLAAISGVRV